MYKWKDKYINLKRIYPIKAKNLRDLLKLEPIVHVGQTCT